MRHLFEFPLELPEPGSRQRQAALHGQLRAAILDGRLKPGLRLPATRELAQSLGVSRNTVVAAYDLLLSEGYVVARHGAGNYVADMAARPAAKPASLPDDSRLATYWRKQAIVQAPPPLSFAYDFRVGTPDMSQFPFEVWRSLSARALRALSKSPSIYAPPQGQPALREAIARHVSFSRAVACEPDDILVTSGAQQAFDLLARVLVTPGRTVVALEDPGYPPMRVAFAAAGARLVPVGVDAEGLIIEQLPPDVGVICVTPSHQFPLGITMSMRRREALIEFARKRNAVIIEDDYDGEFRYEGAPVPALRTGSAADVVFYVGTFSKCMLSALRLGFIVAPGCAIGTLTAAKNCLDWHCPTPVQNAVAAFIAEGHLTRHVRKMRGLYKERRS